MPSPLAHYAIGAAGLQVLDLSRRELALFSLWAAAPDLDALPALVWTLLAPHLPLGADGLWTGAYVFGHRGFSHTFPAALLAALLVWALTRERRHAMAAGLAWSLHVVLDTFTDWSTIPFWPLSDASYMFPLVTGLDPILTILSLATIVALLGPPVAGKLGWPTPTKRARFKGWGRRWGPALAYASAGAVLLSAGFVGWAAALTDGGSALPANTPRTASLDAPADADVDAWNVTTRWLPSSDGSTRQVPYAANASQAPAGTVARAECTLDDLGPFAPIDEPVWTLRKRGDVWIAQARDLVRNATGTGGPQVHIAIGEDRVKRAWIAGEDGEPSRIRLPIPSTLVEADPCP